MLKSGQGLFIRWWNYYTWTQSHQLQSNTTEWQRCRTETDVITPTDCHWSLCTAPPCSSFTSKYSDYQKLTSQGYWEYGQSAMLCKRRWTRHSLVKAEALWVPHLDVRAVVSSQVNSEGEGVFMAHLFEHLHDPMMLCWLRRLNNRTHGWQRRHGPFDVTPGVIGRGLDLTTAVLHVEHAELHLVVFICWERRTHKQEDTVRMVTNKHFSIMSKSTYKTESPIVKLMRKLFFLSENRSSHVFFLHSVTWYLHT